MVRAYLDKATRGTGLTRRLATRFDRPEATISDWIGAARPTRISQRREPPGVGAHPQAPT
ncbi:hypothetical protein [Rhodococcus sp. JVH1]|uniref:hypothetical protein n=1 Tax=Rhodococcus sp. JVH1 TaxID=745408 RepID=UPI0002721336|nr:hypothetical protein [Rhodococcus sp. JVH1]EJI95724.1 hypothetical protein JVH1_6745 [Rhodococcus sp. JVH1]